MYSFYIDLTGEVPIEVIDLTKEEEMDFEIKFIKEVIDLTKEEEVDFETDVTEEIIDLSINEFDFRNLTNDENMDFLETEAEDYFTEAEEETATIYEEYIKANYAHIIYNYPSPQYLEY